MVTGWSPLPAVMSLNWLTRRDFLAVAKFLAELTQFLREVMRPELRLYVLPFVFPLSRYLSSNEVIGMEISDWRLAIGWFQCRLHITFLALRSLAMLSCTDGGGDSLTDQSHLCTVSLSLFNLPQLSAELLDSLQATAEGKRRYACLRIPFLET